MRGLTTPKWLVGFINITVNAAQAGELARTILDQGESYGKSQALDGQVVNLEYVSANPTYSIHIGGARWAAVGDSLARILQASGASVVREYYFNDHGSQIDRFAKSLLLERVVRKLLKTAMAVNISKILPTL